ncbi:unnamed protein product [Closterium sp. NIES-53]
MRSTAIPFFCGDSGRFYHPTSRRVFPSQHITFDESVPFYRLFPYRSAPPPPAPLFLAPGPPPVDPLPPQGPAPLDLSQVDPLPGSVPVEVAVGFGAAPSAASGGAAFGGAEPGVAESEGVGSRGADSGGEEPGGAEPAGVEPGGAESESVEPGGAESEGAETGGSEPKGAASSGGAGVAAGAGGTGGTAATGPGGAVTRAGGSDAGGAGAGRAGAGGAGVGGTGAGGAGAGGTDARGAGQILGVPSSSGLTPPLLCPQPDQLQLPLQPTSPLPAPSPYTEQSGGLTERREPASRPVSPVHPTCHVPCLRPPPVPGTHAMAIRPSSVPLRVPLPAPPESSLPEVPDPESDRARATSPTVSRLLATAVTDCSFDSAAVCALVAELLDFAATCRLDYATALVAESESASASPPYVGGECALGTDVLEDKQEDFECLAAAVPRFASMLLAPEGDPDAPDIPTPRSYAEAIMGPYSSQWQSAMDAEMASWKSTGTYVAGFSVCLQGALHEEIWLRRPPGFTGSFLAGTQWSLRRPVYGLRQAPRKWHDTLRTTLAALGFAPSTADPSLFLRTDISLPQFYVLHRGTDPCEVLQRFGFQYSSPQPTLLSTGHSLSAPPSDESVELSGPYPELVGCLMYLMTTSGMGLVLGGWGPVVLTGHADVSWVDDLATQGSSPGYTFNLGSGSVSWRSTRSSLVLSSSCEAEIYAGAMAAQELCWLTYLLTYLGEQPRSPPVLYVDNKAMIALCQEHRLEHRMKHIALRYFLARELQQRGQLCLAYVAW